MKPKKGASKDAPFLLLAIFCPDFLIRLFLDSAVPQRPQQSAAFSMIFFLAHSVQNPR